jgi:ferrochelatase
LKAEGVTDVVVSPIGFISDHMEVLFDLDTEVRQLADEIGINVIRSATAGVHPAFISMIRELILERTTDTQEKRFMGTRGANHDICPDDCCLAGVGRPMAAKVTTEA